MGNCCTQEVEVEKNPKTSVRQSQIDLSLIMNNDNDGGEISQRKYDELEVAKLKKELFETPQIFVLNNLLMSIMFFENFEREKKRFLRSSVPTLEKELNPTLLRDETINFIMPDVIFENINRNVKFQSCHGPKKNVIEPLIPRRMFVVNDNIEVLESKHTPQYSAIDKPSYQVVIENCKDHQGFVKLKCCPKQPRKIEQPAQEPVPREPSPGPSSNPDDDSEEIYDYTTIANVNTPKPLDITNYERRDTLPTSCFITKKIRKLEETIDEYEDEEKVEEKPVKEEELFETVSYISSDGFMTHFQNAVFPNSLGLALGFDIGEITLAKAIPGKIFCNLQDIDEDFNTLPCEIIPSVAIQWPFDLTLEFFDRPERPTMWDKFGGEYRWPKGQMINEIRSMNCALVPRGYIPKRGENVDKKVEWEVAFPKAQRYLDTHMSHTQIRAFLFLMTIYKSYIEPTNKQYDGLLVDHIRTHMYWECESNPRDWPEHRLGSKLAVVIKNFMHNLSVGRLPDFFIQRRNMFSNVPNKYLTHAQKVFHDVLESPAIYFIGALRNLKYTHSSFYPQFDFKELHAILTASSTQLINPRILSMIPPNTKPKHRRPQVEGDTNYKKEILWKYKKEKLNREKILQKKREQEIREETLKLERRGSVDSVNYEWEPESKFDMFKIRAILMFFIKHFIEMAKKSRRIATQRQALFYLKQAYYLAQLLEDSGLEADAKEWYEIITREEDTSKKLSISESFEHPPSTPKRNSTQFSWEPHQIKGNHSINRNNLNMSYNNTAVGPTFTKLKKHPSSMKNRSSALRTSYQNDNRRSEEIRRNVVGFSDAVEIH